MSLREPRNRTWRQHAHILMRHSWWSKYAPLGMLSWAGRVGMWWIDPRKKTIAHGLSCTECGFVTVNKLVKQPEELPFYPDAKDTNDGHNTWTTEYQMNTYPRNAHGQRMLEQSVLISCEDRERSMFHPYKDAETK